MSQVFRAISSKGAAPALLGGTPSIQLDKSVIITPRKDALNRVRKDGMQLANLSDDLKRDFGVINAALSQNGLALQFVPLDIRDEFVEKACIQNPEAFQFGSEKTRSNLLTILAVRMYEEDVVRIDEEGAVRHATPRGRALLAVHDDPTAFKDLDIEFRKDPEIVLYAVKKNGLNLQFADDLSRSNRMIVREATQENGLALQFAHEDFQANIEIVLGAIQNDPGARRFAHESLQGLSEHELILRLSESDRFDRLFEYLIEEQSKSPEEATKMTKEIQDFVEPKLDRLQGYDPKFYFSTENKTLPRTIHYLPKKNLILICFNKKQNGLGKNDRRLGAGRFKDVHEAFEYRSGRIFARSMGINRTEEECAELLNDVPGIIKIFDTYAYKSPKSGREKRVAISEKIYTTYPHKMNREQKVKAVTDFLKTVEEMHRRGILHTDLHPGNILFSKKLKYIIIDFGEAQIVRGKFREGNEITQKFLPHLFHDLMSPDDSELLVKKIVSENLSAAAVLTELNKILEKESNLEEKKE